MTNAVKGIGTSISIGGNSIDGVTSISAPNIAADSIDVTSLDSGAYKEFISGFVDSGKVDFSANWSASAAHTAVRTAFASRSSVSGEIALNGGGVINFTGLIASWAMEFGVGAAVGVKVGITLNSVAFGSTLSVLSAGSPASLSVLEGGSPATLSVLV